MLQGEGPPPELTQAVDIQHVGDAPVTHVHFRLVLLPALLHQLFQRLGHVLYQTTTTKHVGDGPGCAGIERGDAPRWQCPVFPQPWRVGIGGQGPEAGKGGGTAGRGRGVGGARHHSGGAQRGEPKCDATHTHRGGQRLTGWAREALVCAGNTSVAGGALGQCKTRTGTRNTPYPGVRRRRTPCGSRLHALPAPDPSQIRRTVR